MVVAVWSVKGGVGVTSVAALLAIGQAERGDDTLLVDLCGDVSAVLGMDDAAERPGIAEWSSVPQPMADGLARIEIPVRAGLSFVPRGTGAIGDLGTLASILATSTRQVVVDCGVAGRSGGPHHDVVVAADVSLLVVRECYLVLQAVKRCPVKPTGVVVIREPRRSMGLADVEAVANAPVVACIAADSTVTTVLDAGLLNARLPRSLVRTMSRVVCRAA